MVKPTERYVTRAFLIQLAAGHRKSAKFYRDSKDRTYDQAFLALEIMHNDSAAIIEDILNSP